MRCEQTELKVKMHLSKLHLVNDPIWYEDESKDSGQTVPERRSNFRHILFNLEFWDNSNIYISLLALGSGGELMDIALILSKCVGNRMNFSQSYEARKILIRKTQKLSIQKLNWSIETRYRANKYKKITFFSVTFQFSNLNQEINVKCLRMALTERDRNLIRFIFSVSSAKLAA